MSDKQEQRQNGGLPAEVHAALVETLFGTTGSFIAGMVGGLLVPAVAFARVQDPIYLVCAGVLLALAALRIVVFVLHGRASVEQRLADAPLWERRYAVGAIGFMLAVGVTSAILCYQQHDVVSILYGVLIALGCAGALAGRNAGRPLIVYGQVVGVCLPMAVVFTVYYSGWYVGLAAILGLIMISAKSTTKFLNQMLVNALLNGREAGLQRSRLGNALDSMSHGLCMADKSGAVIVINRRLREFFHLAPYVDELSTKELGELIANAGGMSDTARKAFVEIWEEHLHKAERSVFCEAVGGRVYDFRCEPRGSSGVVVVVEDVTEARTASRQIEQMAHFDVLTGLPNRLLFHRQLESNLLTSAEAGAQLALLSIDLDQFKEVNDTRGHPTGDILLRHASKRLRQTVKESDIVSRFGGDEFQVLMKIDGFDTSADAAADRIIAALSAAYHIDGQVITIGASVGIAFASQCNFNADELMRCADMALYRAKADGRGVCRRYSAELDMALRRKQEIEQDLRDAIANDTLELMYQPIMDLKTGQVVVCEALVRLRHPTKGTISPGEFISIAEETGLIVQLGDWVLKRACADAALWPKSVGVAVNLSAKQFVLRRNLVDDINGALQAAGLDPSRLEVEITESTIIEAKDALVQLRAISAAGIKISLDDFGTGYSSLSYLRQFPVDKIKIDRSFADDIQSRASQAVIGSVSVLGHLLGVQIVMEGIETQKQLRLVKAWNVHLIQGYLFSKPKPLAEILTMLQQQAPAPVKSIRSVA